MTHANATEVVIENRRLALKNLEKVFYPRTGFTKGQVIDYYARVAPAVLPHLRGRPLTLKRYPDGVEGPFFYEKRCPAHRPAWVKTASIWSEANGEGIDFCLANDVPTLIWAANLGDLELHTSMALAKQIERPTLLVLDLDPGPPADIAACCRVGLMARKVLERLGVRGYAKTSGSKGLQVYVPLNTLATYEATKTFARALAELLERAHPEQVASQMRKSLRPGKVFVDWSQNDRHKTTVCVYSLRARERPTVSTPVTWEEVERAAVSGKSSALVFEPEAVLKRVDKLGDLFAPTLQEKQRLPRLGAPSGRGLADALLG